MSNLAYERLHANLQTLGLTTMDATVDTYLENAATKELSMMEVLDHLVDDEVLRRNASAVSTRMKLAGFPVVKTLAEFDLAFQPSIDPTVIRDLATLRFVNNNENLILLGPAGVGKSHLAVALGVEAVKSGVSVYFTTAAELLLKLKRAAEKDLLDRQLKNYGRPRLLIIDEIGYLPMDRGAVHAFFQLISRRYERGSTIFTSNKSYSEWGEILGDAVLAAAVLDRILHHSVTVNIRGESYRLRSRKRAGTSGAAGVIESTEVAAKIK